MDLHPEDLLEREMRGELSPAEQERLELHARQCTACRLERRAREDFRRDDESEAAEADVARLLAAMAGPLALQGLRRPAPASPMRYVRFVSIAAAVVTVTGLAAASRWSEVRTVVMPWAAQSTVGVGVSGASSMVGVSGALPRNRTGAAAPATPVPPVVAPVAVVVEAPAVVAVAETVARHAVVAPAAAPPVSDETGSDAAGVFRRANEARQTGDHLRAGQLYGQLLNRYPSAPEAHASLALFGRMLLDDGNAGGALQCFDDYLRKGGALREEVMLGRALAFQRIGPRASADETRAWNSLIDAYPASVHAERARRRLSELARL